MKKNVIAAILCSAALFSSCQKETEFERENLVLSQNTQKLKDAMLTLASNRLSLKAYTELHSSISHSVEMGLDEISFAKELFSEKKEGKFKSSKISSEFVSSFKNGGLRASSKSSGKRQGTITVEGKELESFLKMSPEEIMKSNVQFYWPNHENWDGKTIPLVALASDDEIITAYRQEFLPNGDVNLSPIKMSEKDAETIPVLIIGEEEVSYETIASPRTVILKPTKKQVASLSTAAPSTGRDIHTLYIGKFRADQLHEPWSKGGPEWRISFVGTQDFEMKSAADTIRFKNLTSLNSYLYNPSRKEAKKKNWIDFGISKPLLTTWIPELVYGHFLIVEEDAAGIQNLKVNLGMEFKPKESAAVKFGIEGTIPKKAKDDIIVNQSLHKDFLMSTGNGYHNKGWTVYESAGVYYTLPMIKNTIYK